MEGIVCGELILDKGMDPGGVVGLVAVTVGLVVHQFAGMNTLLLVDLPKDDATFFGGAEAVAISGVLHLWIGEVAFIDEGLAEGRLSGEGFLDERWIERGESGGG